MADPPHGSDLPAAPISGSSNAGTVSHRSSFAENLRGSPRSQRHPSLTQSAVQSLIDHPPSAKGGDPRFAGRDWRGIKAGELVDRNTLKWAQLDTSVEEATNVSVLFRYILEISLLTLL